MRNPGIVTRIQDSGSVTKPNRERRSSAGRRRRNRRGNRGEGGEIHPCGNIARVHTWPELCSCGYRPSDADRGWKGEGKRAQSGESLRGIQVVAARGREREKRERGKRERSRVWMLRFQLRIRPVRRFQRRSTAGNRIGIKYATINDTICAMLQANQSARILI